MPSLPVQRKQIQVDIKRQITMSGQAFFVKLRALSHVLVNSWLTPGKFYEMSREDPEIGFVMGWATTTHHKTLFS